MLDEIGNNSVLSIGHAIAEKKPAFRGENRFAVVFENNKPCGCLIQIEAEGLAISDLPSDSISNVCDALADQRMTFDRISGPFESSVSLAMAWSTRIRSDWHIAYEWQIFRADEIKMPKKPAEGELGVAGSANRLLIERWGSLYGEEKPAPVDVAAFLLAKLEDGELYFWNDNGPKTLVAVSGKTKNCARISAVYTPTAHRGKGYASIAVAEVTRELMESGIKTCTLVVDRKDSDVMQMYELLGYRKTDTQVNIMLDAP